MTERIAQRSGNNGETMTGSRFYKHLLDFGAKSALTFLVSFLAGNAALAHGGHGGGGGHCGGGHCGGHPFSGGHVGGFSGGHFSCGHSHYHFHSHGFSSANSTLNGSSLFNSNLNSSTIPASVNAVPLPTDPDAAVLGIGALTPEEELINQRAKRVGFFGHLHRMFNGGRTP